MSMLSAQCDELLTMAAMLVVKDMPEIASVVRDAADTILELRDGLQRANAENDKLRQENQSIGMASYEIGYKSGSIHYELEHCPACKNVADLQEVLDENAELRELCETVIDDWMSKVCPTFPFCEFGGEYESCTDDTCGNQLYRQMLRELGVEVDE